MYKSVLVHVDGSERSAQRVAVAARLALAYDGHVIGAAFTGISAFVFPVGGFEPGVPAIAFPFEQLRAEADRALDAFASAARRAGVSKVEQRRLDEEAGVGISMLARYADLVVISRGVTDLSEPRLRGDFPEYVLLNCARPVLLVPAGGIRGELGKRVAVAWNGSADAVRAITSALPLLRTAERVDLLIFNAADEPDLHGEAPGAEMALYLARHGVAATVTASDTDLDPGAALLAWAAEHDIDLIVMGAYGRSRFSEFLLGGATRSVLRASPLPLWMAH